MFGFGGEVGFARGEGVGGGWGCVELFVGECGEGAEGDHAEAVGAAFEDLSA